ncbi:MAG: PstS family phosphate ABC transporter substrate-binding protein [Nanoarchaeota archaeon]
MNYKYLGVGIILLILLISGFYIINNKSPLTGNAVKNSDSLEIKGSDTLLQVVSNLAESYSNENKNTKLSVTGGGSGGGIASLINGEINIADASRKIKDEELANAEKNGRDIWEFIIARDMLSLIVNKDNPIDKLTKGQLAKIYSGQITNWKELGGNDQKITLYGRQSTSGTYVFFMEHVIKGDYSPEMRNLEGNQAILDSVKQDKSGIGYVGVGYVADKQNEVRIIKVAENENSEYISPIDKSKINQYSISRPLYQYTAKKPEKNSEVFKFINFELSEEGQKIVENAGFDTLLPSDKEHNQELISKI